MYNIHFCTLGLSFGNEYGYNSIAGHEYSVQSMQPTTWGKPEKSWNPAFTFNFIPTSHLMNWLLAHLTQRVMWAIVTTERPLSVRPLTFHILINSSEATGPIWTKLWLDGPLPKLYPVISISNQDGHQAKNRKKGGWNFNCPLLL
jgi:hypothetical protein